MSTTENMSVTDIANELVALCRQGKNDDAIDKLYSPDIVSVESASMPDMPSEMRGIDAIRGKSAWWTENNEVHAADVNGPFLTDGNQFAVEFTYETTFKPTGERQKMHEMALYTVEGNHIVHEHFFYRT